MRRRKEDQIGKSCSLQHLRLELTHDCPLNCLHCSSCSDSGSPLQLPEERVIGVIHEFAGMGGKEIAFTGGEPLAYSGLQTVLEYSNSAGFRPVLFTSGVAREGMERRPVSDKELAQLKSLVSRVVFSLYSADEERHDRVTQIKGSFTASLDAIGRCVALGIPTDVHFVPMKINYGDLPGVAQLCHAVGIQSVRILRLVPHGRAKNCVSALLPSVDDYQALSEAVEITRRRYLGLIHVGAAFSSLIPNLSEVCLAATGKVVVTADGSVAPCDGFKNFEPPSPEWSIYHKSLPELHATSPLLCQVRAARNGSIHRDTLSGIPTDRLGCMAQESLAYGFVTCSGLDPSVSQGLQFHAVR